MGQRFFNHDRVYEIFSSFMTELKEYFGEKSFKVIWQIKVMAPGGLLTVLK